MAASTPIKQSTLLGPLSVEDHTPSKRLSRPLSENVPELETTNWNAVKSLAGQHGIVLQQPPPYNNGKSNEATTSIITNDDDPSSEPPGSSNDAEEETDLGVGTPFKITARRNSNGRTVYRFRARDAEAASTRGMTSSGSSGSVHSGMQADTERSPTKSIKRPGLMALASGLRNRPSNGLLRAAMGQGSSDKAKGTSSSDMDDEPSPATMGRLDSRVTSSGSLRAGDVLGAILSLPTGPQERQPSLDSNRSSRGQPSAFGSLLAVRADFSQDVERPLSQAALTASQTSSSNKGKDFAADSSAVPVLPPIPTDAPTSSSSRLLDQSGQEDVAHTEVTAPTSIFDAFQLRNSEPPQKASSSSHGGASFLALPCEEDARPPNTLEQPVRSSFDLGSPQDRARTTRCTSDDPRYIVWAVQEETEVSRITRRDGRKGLDSNPATPLSAQPPITPSSASRSFATWNASTTSVGKRRSRTSSQEPRTNVAADASPRTPKTPKKGLSGSSGTSLPSSNSGQSPRKAFPLAATRARLIAELTSEIDNRLMTDFFYTFRIYMTTHQLLDLLCLRFKWALGQPRDVEDDAHRRIVRVRTYVIIKYWLTKLFEVDFLPDRVLRSKLTTWLNDSGSDPAIRERPADLKIIKSLKQVVRGMKQAYTGSGVSALISGEAGKMVSAERPTGPPPGEAKTSSVEDAQLARQLQSPDLLANPSLGHGGPSSEGLRPAFRLRSTSADSTLPLAATEASPPPPNLPSSANAFSRAFVNTVGRLSRMKRHMGQRHHSTTEAGLIDASETDEQDSGDLLYTPGGVENLLRFFEQDSESEQETSGTTGTPSAVSDGTAPKDGTPSLSASSARSGDTPASSLDLSDRSDADRREQDEAQHGLGIEGAVSVKEEDVARLSLLDALRIPDVHTAASRDGSPHTGSTAGQQLADDDDLTTASQGLRPSGLNVVHHAGSDQTLRSMSSNLTEQGASPVLRPAFQPVLHTESSRRQSDSRRSHRHSATQSLGSFRGPDIVQLDDIDLSSDEEDGAVQRALRRLPGARDLRMANKMEELQLRGLQRRSFDSTSSYGQVWTNNRPSVSGPTDAFLSISRGSIVRPRLAFSPLDSDLFDPDDALAGYELVKGFRMEDVASDGEDDDDEGLGGVEEALRRLEGFIDEDKKAARAKRVEALWQQSQLRQMTERRLQGEDDDDNGNKSHTDIAKQVDGRVSSRLSAPVSAPVAPRPASLKPADSTLAPNAELWNDLPSSAPPTSSSKPIVPSSRPQTMLPTSTAPLRVPSKDSTPSQRVRNATTDGAPLKIDTAVSPTGRTTEATQTGLLAPPAAHAPHWTQVMFSPQRRSAVPRHSVRPTAGPQPPVHRCFLLGHKTDVLARQFALIECELFTAVDWSELVSERWKTRHHKFEVLDWEDFYRSRVRCKATSNARGKRHEDAAVEAIVARFNLTCNWVASEVLLTRNLDERVAVISKLIRLAFKCYQQLNFATLVQICFGLQTPWVERLKKTWSRVGLWEMRIFKDLKALTSPRGNFRPLRNAMNAMVADEHLEELVTSTGPPQPGPRTPHGGGGGGGGAGGDGHKTGGPGIGLKMMDRCIPFFGLFLSDLSSVEALPTFVDPSQPDQGANQDPSTGKLASLRRPEALAALPLLPVGVELEAMVNLYKCRHLAAIVKTVLAFQAKASNYDYAAEGNVYVKCLRIRCLDGHQMTRISQLIADG